MFRRIAVALLAIMLVGCAAKVGGRKNYKELTIAQHWAHAQYMLASYTNGASYDVPYAMFTWKFKTEPVHVVRSDGSEFWGSGYFNWVDMEILIVLQSVPGQVIEHEACHAILFVLGDPTFVSYCHDPARPWIHPKE